VWRFWGVEGKNATRSKVLLVIYFCEPTFSRLTTLAL
jgi:hypothetical protein